jgi:glyoxylase-like metal-dependent hydrolase (beta-lactamase superfamily II)
MCQCEQSFLGSRNGKQITHGRNLCHTESMKADHMDVETYGATMRVLHPHPNILAFYDGRVAGQRLFSAPPNWLDDGAYALGICSYALVDGDQALVYDTHISLSHARIIRRTLEERGVRHMRVVLSHWHDDHVAGNEIFADCEIIATRQTAAALAVHREALEGGSPPISPLIMPTLVFEGSLALTVGRLTVELRHAEIHSDDAALLLWPAAGILLAGDTMEDSVTYVAEPARLGTHLAELDRVAGWDFATILPNHGRAEVIAAGGYGRSLIEATRCYTRRLIAVQAAGGSAALPLRDFAAAAFATGGAAYFAPYEAVHRHNLAAIDMFPAR